MLGGREQCLPLLLYHHEVPPPTPSALGIADRQNSEGRWLPGAQGGRPRRWLGDGWGFAHIGSFSPHKIPKAASITDSIAQMRFRGVKHLPDDPAGT